MLTRSARYEASHAGVLRRLLLACTLIFPTVAAAQSDRWTLGTGWLWARYPQSIAIDPQNPSTIWAGGCCGGPPGTGLARSDDGGLSWVPIDSPGAPEEVGTLVLNPENGSTMYTAFNDVRRSDDGGAHWVSFPAPASDQPHYNLGIVNVLAIDPHSPQRLWAATSEGPNGGLSRSDDGGATWTAAGVTKEVYEILFDDRRPGTIYASSYDHEYTASYYGHEYIARAGGPILSSADGGATWVNRRDFGYPVFSFAVDPQKDGVVYAGSLGAVHRSADYGSTWETLSQGVFEDLFEPTSTDRFPWGWAESIVVDPVRRDRLYAAVDWEVYRSFDAGRTWHRAANGLPPGPAKPLAISPDGGRLYVGSAGSNPVTGVGVYWLDLGAVEPPYACRPDGHRLCLTGGRYAVELVGGQPRASNQLASARAFNDRSGYFSLPFVTGDEELPEVIVKMLPEGTFGPGAPLFYTSLTTLGYFLRVTDTVTGATKEYRHDWEAPLCGRADIAFGATASTPHEPLVMLGGRELTVAELGLLENRFGLTLTARHARTGRTATGHGIFVNDRFGYFSFPEVTGDAQFPEVLVKMLDFRSITGSFLLFHAGLTGFDYTLTVTDQQTGAVRTYQSSGEFCGAVESIAPGN
jgi:photosystem II stability/assembly factor-like uncharacterized protein